MSKHITPRQRLKQALGRSVTGPEMFFSLAFSIALATLTALLYG